MGATILKPCHHPGCRAFALLGGARCAQHRHAYDRGQRTQVAPLREAARLRGSHRWKQTREAFKITCPLCCDPFKRHGPEPTYAVHHVVPLVEAPELAFEWSNLRPTCTSCHAEIEAMERQGQPTRQLFL